MNNLLLAAEKWLNEMGVKTEQRTGCLLVSRKDMVKLIDSDEDSSYLEVLSNLKQAISPKLFWGFKGPEWMHLESF